MISKPSAETLAWFMTGSESGQVSLRLTSDGVPYSDLPRSGLPSFPSAYSTHSGLTLLMRLLMRLSSVYSTPVR